MPETTPLIKAALNLRVGAGFDVYVLSKYCHLFSPFYLNKNKRFIGIYRICKNSEMHDVYR